MTTALAIQNSNTAIVQWGDRRMPERFWNKTIPEPNSGCWLWLGGGRPAGYGEYSIANRHVYAHRAAYEALVGAIPPGLQIDHLCKTPCCVNPAHLEPVTQRENLMRGNGPAAILARRTHCHRGHELTGDNVYSHVEWRRCRACAMANNKRAYHARKKRAA